MYEMVYCLVYRISDVLNYRTSGGLSLLDISLNVCIISNNFCHLFCRMYGGDLIRTMDIWSAMIHSV